MRRFPSRPVVIAGLSVCVLALIAVLALALSHTSQRPTLSAGGSPCAAPHDACTGTLADFLQKSAPSTVTWTRQAGRLETTYVAFLPQVGAFAVDASGRHVILAVFTAPSDNPGAALSIDQAQAVALAYADEHFPSGRVSALPLREQTGLDHGAFQEFSFTWQDRQGDAWLPTYVHVGVTPTGAIREFSYFSAPLTIGTQPTLSAATATAKARLALSLPPTMSLTSTTLEVLMTSTGTEQLVWHVVFEGVRDSSAQRTDAMVDARSGDLLTIS